METPPPISFARGAPSLDIVAVDELRGCRAARVRERSGRHHRLRHRDRLRAAARVDRRVPAGRARAGRRHERVDAGRRVPVPAAGRAGRPRDRRGAELRPHAALAARAGRRPDGDPAPGGRRGRRGDRARVRERRAPEARPHHPQLPQPRRLHALAREAAPAARPREDLRLRRLRGRPVRRAPLRGRDAADDALARRRRSRSSTRPPSRRPSAPASASATWPARRR